MGSVLKSDSSGGRVVSCGESRRGFGGVERSKNRR